VYLQLSAGNVNDCKMAIEVLSHVELAGSMVIGDRGYDSDEIMLYIEDQEAGHTIPPRSNLNYLRLYRPVVKWLKD